MNSGLDYYTFYPNEVTMAKKPKPVYEFTLGDDEDIDEQAIEFLYDKYMEDISEIMGRAYQDIGKKVRDLLDAVGKDE